MDRFALIRQVVRPEGGRILLLVLDGAGGLPDPATGLTELETARTPHLDALAAKGVCGVTDPVLPGITPGSGPGHLALFDYDPLRFTIGRGALSAAGVGLELQPGDVAARANFCTLDAEGRVTDRRAGRISTALAETLAARLDGFAAEGVTVTVRAEKEHRAAVVFRGEGLDPRVRDTDPQATGVPPFAPEALHPAAEKTARVVAAFLAAARRRLAGEERANGLLLRGFAGRPHLPSFAELYRLRAACIATYPMYRGVARLCGMTVLPAEGESLADEITCLERHWEAYDFFFLHVKAPDAAGEDGDFARKVRLLEEVDAVIPRLEALGPEVFVVTADHSTPARMRTHSWHPAPFVLVSPLARPDGVERFGERALARGGLGRFQAVDAMVLMLAHAGRLAKFGA